MSLKFNNPTPPGGGGGGTVTNVSSANTDIAVSSGTTTPILTLNSGAGANQIVKRDGSGNLNAQTVTTNANLTGDVTSVGNATTLTNAPVIAKVLTGYTSGAGTVASTDSILQAIQKLNGNDATNANLTGDVTSVGNATTIKSSVALAGSPTTTTQSASDNSTKISTTAYADAIASLKANKAQEAWISPTLLNSWVNFGGGYSTAAYMKDTLGFVHLKGFIKSGTVTAGTPLFTLPVGYRPSEVAPFSRLSNNGTTDIHCIIEVRTATGNVVIGATIPGNTWLMLDGISFLGEV